MWRSPDPLRGPILHPRRGLRRLLFRRVPPGTDGIARVGPRHIYILPTRSGLRFGAVILVMLLGSLNFQNNLGLLFSFFLGSVALVAMHHTWFNLLGLSVRARGGAPVFAGGEASFDVVIGGDGRRTRYDIRLPGRAVSHRSIAVPGGDLQTIRLGLPAVRRGLQALCEVTVETRYPLHLFRAWCYAETDAATLVYPRPALQAAEPDRSVGGNRRSALLGPVGADDYLGPRAYRDGDSPRQIDWKAVARERGLVVKQFGGEAGEDVWIDWAKADAADAEARISLLTRQLLDASEAGARFGLRLPGGEEGLGRGPAHLQRCLTRLALYDDDQTSHPSDRAS